MAIVCGTDFSERSREAADVAAHLAARTNTPLHLVHAFDARDARMAGETEDRSAARMQDELQHEAELLRRTGADVRVHRRTGSPDDILLEVADEFAAQLIVVAALGHRPEGKWRVGSHADRLAQRSHVPVWVVRASDPILRWIRQERPLRVLIGADLSVSAERAMGWVSGLCSLGECKVTVVNLYWPPQQFDRLGLSGVRDYAGPHPEVQAALERDLHARLARAMPSLPASVRVEPHMGSIGDAVSRLAEDDVADLIVVGSHDRNALERVFTGSVSHAVLHSARVSVVCVPAPARAEAPRVVPLHRILVPTDFSPAGDAAVSLAYSAVAPGGTVHLVHVNDAQTPGEVAARDIFPSPIDHGKDRLRDYVVHRMLADLVPLETRGRITSELHVLESENVAEAICQAAERLDVSAICLGTHGRNRAARALLGSVSNAVLQGSRRPVLFARTPTD